MPHLIKCISCGLVWDKDSGTIDVNNGYEGYFSHGLCTRCLKEKSTALFRARQRKEGNFDCFAKSNGFCDQFDCKYRAVCLELSTSLERRGKFMKKCTYCGSEYFPGFSPEGFCCLECQELYNKKILLICKKCESVFSTTFTRKEQRTCSIKCADFLFRDILNGKSPLKISFLCPICYKEHYIRSLELLFFDSSDCLNEFTSLFGLETLTDLQIKFRNSLYSCERCGKSLHLRLIRSKGEFKILCAECSSLLRSYWNDEDSFICTLPEYQLEGQPLFKKYTNDAGQDLRSIESKLLNPRQSYFFKTGISIQIPYDCVALVKPRSGLAKRYSLSILAGVIDSNYRGEIRVGLINLGCKDCQINIGDRIAQLLILQVNLKRSKVVDVLDNTDRSSSGFGHTGV